MGLRILRVKGMGIQDKSKKKIYKILTKLVASHVKTCLNTKIKLCKSY